jgi:hypothetical protein
LSIPRSANAGRGEAILKHRQRRADASHAFNVPNAQLAQHAADGRAHLRLVVDDQHAARPLREPGHAVQIRQSAGGSFTSSQ